MGAGDSGSCLLIGDRERESPVRVKRSIQTIIEQLRDVLDKGLGSSPYLADNVLINAGPQTFAPLF